MVVDWNKDTFNQYLSKVFIVKPEWKEQLLADFITLKSSSFGIIPNIFGKDGPYTQPESVAKSGLYHVHLLLTKDERKGLNQFNKTSNAALVYSKHQKIDNFYTLLAIFPINAHQFAKDTVLMTELATHANNFQSLTTHL